MQQTMTMERFLEQRDMDAALYLVQRMLNLKPEVLRKHRENLEGLEKKLQKRRRITEDERNSIVCTYREVVG